MKTPQVRGSRRRVVEGNPAEPRLRRKLSVHEGGVKPRLTGERKLHEGFRIGLERKGKMFYKRFTARERG